MSDREHAIQEGGCLRLKLAYLKLMKKRESGTLQHTFDFDTSRSAPFQQRYNEKKMSWSQEQVCAPDRTGTRQVHVAVSAPSDSSSGNRCAASASLQPASTMSHSSASGADQTAATTVSNSVPGFAPYHPPPHQLNQPMSGPPPPAPPSVPLPSGATAPSTTSSDRALYGPSTSGLHGLFISLCD